MKRLILFLILLSAFSLACQTVQRIVASPVPTASPTLTAPTPSPAPTETPTPTATVPAPVIEPIVCNDDTCIQACLDRIEKVLEAEPFEKLNEAEAEKEAEVDLVNYLVDGDALEKPVMLRTEPAYTTYQEDIAAHERIWKYFIAILPAEQRKWVRNFIIFTDGKRARLAWVRRTPDSEKWTLGADILDSKNPVVLTETLVHEFGHLLTLNNDQLMPGENRLYGPLPESEECPQYQSPEGCTNPDSYLNQFFQRFWTEIYPEWFENVWLAGGNPKLVAAFHYRYSEQFVSEYAASRPEEDLAESFAYFVLNPRPEGRSIADQKVQFFYEYPELVALRQYTIQGICSYVK